MREYYCNGCSEPWGSGHSENCTDYSLNLVSTEEFEAHRQDGIRKLKKLQARKAKRA